MADKPINVLRDALSKWDTETTYKNPPYLLKGGYERFLLSYPHSVTNPRARAPEVAKSFVETAPSLDFEVCTIQSYFFQLGKGNFSTMMTNHHN